MSITPTFAGEMQLAGWSETHAGGCKVTFWLESSEDLDAFRALTVRKGNTAGHRFMAALVEIGDDEQPVQPIPSNPGELEKPKGGALAKLAGMWCEDPVFRSWLKREHTHSWTQNEVGGTSIAEVAARTIRSICQVSSRAELDSDHRAEDRFQRLIRGPYMKHHVSMVAA